MSKLEDNLDSDEKSSRRLTPGTVLGDFKITRYLDSGSMGTVYVAEQLSLGREVAIKIFSRALAPEPESREQFLNEIKLTASLDHPNIVSAIGAGQEGDYIYLAMKYIDARDLGDLLSEYPRIDESDALEIIEAIADALSYAWDEKKLIHRDIKPGNIKLSSSTKPHLLDLGISITNEQECALTAAGYVIGTPDYMSPEQCMGGKTVDFRTDVYSLGATLYHMVTGTPPFQRSSPEGLLQAQIHDELQPPSIRNPKVSKSTCHLITTMMQKDPDQRPKSWRDVIQAVRLARKQRREQQASPSATATKIPPPPIAAHPQTPPAQAAVPLEKEPTSHKSNNKTIVAVIAGVAVMILLVLLATCSPRKEADDVKRSSPDAPAAPAQLVDHGPDLLENQSYETPEKLSNLRLSLAKRFNAATNPQEKAQLVKALEKLDWEERAAEQIVDRLREQALDLQRSAGTDQAIQLVNRYEGLNQDWVQARRSALEADIQRVAKQSPKERQKEESRELRRIHAIATMLAMGNFSNARKQYREAELQPQTTVPAELRDAKSLVSLDLMIADSFRAQIGQVVTVTFPQGPRQIRVKEIDNSRIIIESVDSDQTQKKITRISWENLAPAEWEKRLANRSDLDERMQVLLLSTPEHRKNAIATLQASNRAFLKRVGDAAQRKSPKRI